MSTRPPLKTPVQFMLFDLLEQDGRSLMGDSYDERREALRNLVSEQGPIHVPPAFEGDVEHAMDSSRQLGLEGVLAKRRGSTYSAGRRSRAWIKIKHHLTQEVVIGGWRPGKGNRSHTIGSLLVGVPADGGLRYIGRVGTGFGEKQLADMDAPVRPAGTRHHAVPRRASSGGCRRPVGHPESRRRGRVR